MAVNSYDATDGHPVFLDTDAPDIKVDPTKVAEYAAKVGTRLIGSTAARTGYAYAREGLCWFDTTLDEEFIHNGSGWVSVLAFDTGWQTLTPAGGWTAFGSGLKWRKVNGMVTVLMSVTRASWSGTQTFGTLPSGSRPIEKVTFASVYGDTAQECYVNTSGTIQVNASGSLGLTGSVVFPAN